MNYMAHLLSFSLYRRMELFDYVSRVMKKAALYINAKTKANKSFVATAQVISAFVFAT